VSKKTWQKVLLGVVIIIPILLTFIWGILSRYNSFYSQSTNDPLSVAKDGIGTAANSNEAATVTRDEKYAEFIAEEKEKREKVDAEAAKEMMANETDHKAIDNADSVGGVDAVLANRRNTR